MFQINATQKNRCDVSTQSTHLGPLVLLLSNQAFVPTHTHVSNIQLNIPPPHVMPPLHAHAHTFNRVLRCCKGSCYERVRAHVSASRVYAGDTAAFVDACAEPYLTAAVGGSRTSQALEFVHDQVKAHHEHSQHAFESRRFMVNGIAVCSTAYFCLTAIPKATFYRHLKAVKCGSNVYIETRGGASAHVQDLWASSQAEEFILE